MQDHQQEILRVTDSAQERIAAFREMFGDETAAVRITVHPEAPVQGKYELEFVADVAEDGDVRVGVGEVVFILDSRSAVLLNGTCIDYVEGMWSSGFRFDNPNRLQVMSDPLAEEVNRILNDEIAPLLAIHGGRVSLVDVREGSVYLQFGGGCQGCGLAPQTLKQIVVAQLREFIPSICDVFDVTDHSAGENPYLRQS